jgi:hypothetical protein
MNLLEILYCVVLANSAMLNEINILDIFRGLLGLFIIIIGFSCGHPHFFTLFDSGILYYLKITIIQIIDILYYLIMVYNYINHYFVLIFGIILGLFVIIVGVRYASLKF